MKKQVDENFYNFSKYCDLNRWCSYWYQISEIFKKNPRNILEIGIGGEFLKDIIKTKTNIDYVCMDVAEDLNPDIVGSVEKIPAEKNKFDVVCAFEVLEHLPFEKFEICLKEMARVSRKYLIISLPHWGRHFSIDIRVPYFKRFNKFFKISFPKKKHKFNGQHYWEVGKKDYPLKRIKKSIKECNLKIEKSYIIFESPYHHMFVLSKK